MKIMIILLLYIIFLIGLRLTTYPDTLATTVINCTKAHFARHGIPEIRYTENCPKYISNELKIFSRTDGFQNTRSAPYYPKRNG